MMNVTTRKRELQIAREMLAGWIEAEKAVMTAQSYRMGTRELRRADLKEIRESIKYWQNEVYRLEGRPRNRIRQVIPRDL